MKILKKSLSLLLCFVMVISSLTVTSFAADGTAVTTDTELAAAFKAGGTYYLANDITLTSAYSVGSNAKAVTIDLNGHNITADSTFNSRFFNTAAYQRTVTIKNSQTTGGRIHDITPSSSLGSFIYMQLGSVVIDSNVTIDNCGRTGNPLIKMAYNSTYQRTLTIKGTITNCSVKTIVETATGLTKDGAQNITVGSGAKILNNTISGDAAIVVNASTTSTFTKQFTYTQAAGYVQSVKLGDDARVVGKISGGYIGTLTMGSNTTSSVTGGHLGTDSTVYPASGYTYVNPTFKEDGDAYPCTVASSTSTFSVKYYDGDTELIDLSNATATVSGVATPTEVNGETVKAWNTAANQSGKSIVAGDTLYALAGQEISLYAVREGEEKVSVQYFDGDAEYTDIMQSADAGASTTAQPAQTKDGYYFKEWNSAADGSGTSYAPGATISLGTDNIKLYAQWYEESEVVAALTPEGGSVSYYTDIESAISAAVEASTNSSGTNAGTEGYDVTIKLFKDVLEGQLELRKGGKASYDTVTRTITFDLNGHSYKCTAGSNTGAFVANNNTTVVIGGGAFIAGHICNGNSGSKYILKSDGYFNSIGSIKGSYVSSITIEPGAKFVNDPSSLLTSSYSVKDINETYGEYTYNYQVEEAAAVISVDGVRYSDMSEAITAIKSDSTVKLLNDATLPETIKVEDENANITFDLSGKTLTATEGVQLFNITDGKVTIENGTIVTGSSLIGMGHIYVKDADLYLNSVIIDSSAIIDSSKVIYSEGFVYVDDALTTDNNVYQAKSLARFTKAALDLSADLTMKYTTEVALGTNDTEKTIALETSEGKTEEAIAPHGSGDYIFTNTITTAQMANEITATVMLGDEKISDDFNYSVLKYAHDAKAADPDNTKLSTLLANTLAMGSEMQKYWKMEGSVAFDVPSEFKDFVITGDVPSTVNVKKTTSSRTTEGNKIKNATLYVTDKFAVRLSLYAQEGNTLEVTIDGTPINTVTINKTYTAENPYEVTLDALSPTQYNKTLVASIKDPDGNVLHAVSYSVNSYFYQMQSNEVVGDLSEASYGYGKAAQEYKYGYAYLDPIYEWSDDYTSCTGTLYQEDGPTIYTTTNNITREVTSTSPEVCTYTATFVGKRFTTQVATGVATEVVGIETNINDDTTYLPTVNLYNQFMYRPIYTGGARGEWDTFCEKDFKNISFEDGTISADIDMTIHNKNITSEISLPEANKVSVSKATSAEDGTTFLINGVVVDAKTSDFRKDVVLYDADSNKSVNVIFFTTSDIISNFTNGDEISIPVKKSGDNLIYAGDYSWTNYIDSTGNDISGYTGSYVLPTINSVEITSMPEKTSYDYRCSASDLNLKGGQITLTYSDGTTVIEDLSSDMLAEDTSSNTALGSMIFTVTVDGASDTLALNYSYVSVDGFNELEVGDKSELHAIVVGTSTNYAGSISQSNGEIIVRDMTGNTLMGIAGLNTTSSDPFAGLAVGDEIIVSVTKSLYSTSNSNNGKEYAAVISADSCKVLSQGNDATVDKSSAVEISSQEEFAAFLGENGSRSDSFYKLVKLDAGVKFGKYSSTSDSSYIFFNDAKSVSSIKVDGLAPYVVNQNMTYNVGKTLNELLFNGEMKTLSSGGSMSTRDVYMVFIGGVGAYYHQFILLDESYIGEEYSFVSGSIKAPYKTSYLVGEGLDLTGGSISEVYSSKTFNNTVSLDNQNVVMDASAFNKDVEGTYSIKFTYNEREYSYDVEVIDKSVTAISLNTGLDQAVDQRTTLDNIDLADATINVTFGDGTNAVMPITRSMLPSDSTISMGTNNYTVTYGGQTTSLEVTKEVKAISVSEFIDAESGTYEVEGIVVGPVTTNLTTELLIMDENSGEIIGIQGSGVITVGSDKCTIDTSVCKSGDKIVATLTKKSNTNSGTTDNGKTYASATDFATNCIVLSSGNTSYPDPESSDVTTISSQDELSDFLINNDDRFYSIVKLVTPNGVNYSGSMRIYFGDEVNSYTEQCINYSGTTNCSPILSAANEGTYVSGWTSYFDNATSEDYASPATCDKAIYAIYIGGNSYYEHFVILDSSYFTDDTSSGGESEYPERQSVNVHTSDKGEAPALQLIRNADGSYGGTLNLNKYGEGAPLNGADDHLDSVYYSYNDYYNIKCTSSRVLIPHFSAYQQTMANSDGIACALMLFNRYGEDVSGEFSEENLVKDYESLNNTTIYGNGTTAEGLVNLFESKGYEARIDTAAASSNLSSYFQNSLNEGRIPCVYYHQDTTERFVLVIGYDNMGTPSTGDDVVILANSFDVYDHYQDGYQITKLAFLSTWMCSVDLAGNTTRKYECFSVTPKTAETFEYSDVDELITNPSIGDRHILYNLDGTMGGAYNIEEYGAAANNVNGYYNTDGQYIYSCEHFAYNYYAYPDIYNMTNTSSRAVLTGFSTFQQTMASSCGISSTLNTLNYLGYDLTKLSEYVDDPDFGTIEEGDYGKIQEAIVKIYETGDENFINNPSRKFNNYGGVGAGNLSKVPVKLGFYDTTFGRYYRSNVSGGNTSSVPFKTYDEFLAFAKEQLYSGQPIIFCGPNHWRVIIGIDDMGTESTYDDIIFLADSSDKWDHYQNGVDTEAAMSFYARWYNGGRSTNQQYILIKAGY